MKESQMLQASDSSSLQALCNVPGVRLCCALLIVLWLVTCTTSASDLNAFTAQLNFPPNYKIVKIVCHYQRFLVRSRVQRAVVIQKVVILSVFSTFAECCDADVSEGALPAENNRADAKSPPTMKLS